MAETASPISKRVVRVLLIDDDEDDFFLTRDLLEEISSTDYEVEWQADTESALEKISSGAYEVVLVDYRLGARTGLDLIREAQQHASAIPMILLTGQGQREIDYAAMKAGAADYLEKGRLDSTLLERAIRYAIQNKQSEEDLERRVSERTAQLAKTNLVLEREIRERQRAKKLCARSTVERTNF